MELRIVGLSSGNESVTVQARWKKSDEWHQECMSFECFDLFFKTHFSNYYRYFEMAKENEIREMEDNELAGFSNNANDSAAWFYNFGETHEMKRLGEAYIFSI